MQTPEFSYKDNLSKLKVKRTRKKTSYTKINNETRKKLIEMIYIDNYSLKDAASILNINYSTAKTIVRIFRIEKRIEKKNAVEERELQQVIKKFKQTKEENVDVISSYSKQSEELSENKNSFASATTCDSINVQCLLNTLNVIQGEISHLNREIRTNQNLLHYATDLYAQCLSLN